MTAQHTPGPWSVKPEEVDRAYIRVRGTHLGGRFKIANVLTPNYEGSHPREADETRANARLIAAAPELLAVVIHARNVLPNEHWADDTRRMLDAAIARATHKEQT